MRYFGPKNALAKYIWKVLKNRSNEIRIRRGPLHIVKKSRYEYISSIQTQFLNDLQVTVHQQISNQLPI